MQNDTIIVKNANSHIIDEAICEDDATKTRQQTPHDSSEESIQEEE